MCDLVGQYHGLDVSYPQMLTCWRLDPRGTSLGQVGTCSQKELKDPSPILWLPIWGYDLLFPYALPPWYAMYQEVLIRAKMMPMTLWSCELHGFFSL